MKYFKNKKRLVIILIVILLIISSVPAAYFINKTNTDSRGRAATQQSVTYTFSTAHPRGLFRADQLAAIKNRAVNESLTKLGFSYKTSADTIINSAKSNFTNNNGVLTPKPYVYNIDLITCSNNTTITNFSYTLSDTEPDLRSDCYYPLWTGVTSGLQQRIEYLSLASLLTPDTTLKSQFYNLAKSDITSISNWAQWTDTHYYCAGLQGANLPHACLSTSFLTRSAAIFYDFFYNDLNASFKSSLENTILTKGMAKILDSISYPALHQNAPNGLFTLEGTFGLTAVILWDKLDQATKDNYFTKFNDAVSYSFLNYLAADGGSYESSVYGSLFETVLQAFNAFNQNGIAISSTILNSSYMQNYPKYLSSSINMDGTLSNYNDGNRVYLNQYSWFLFYAYKYNSNYSTTVLSLINKFPKYFASEVSTLLWYDDSLTTTIPSDITWNSSFYKNTGLVSLKDTSNRNEQIYVKSPATVHNGHQHYDIGGIDYSYNGNCLLCDPGKIIDNPGLRQYGISTRGHNSILVDPQYDTNEKLLSGGQNWTTKGTGTITLGNGYDVFGVDYKDSYNTPLDTNNPSQSDINNYQITKAQRKVVSLRGENPYFIINDSITSGINHNYQELFHNRDANFNWNDTDKSINVTRLDSDAKVFLMTPNNISYSLDTPPTSVPTSVDDSFAKISIDNTSSVTTSAIVIPEKKKHVELTFRNRDDKYLAFESNAPYSIDTTTGKDDTKSLKITDNDSDEFSKFRSNDYLKVDPTKQYNFSLSTKSENGTQGIYVGLEYYDSNFQVVRYGGNSNLNAPYYSYFVANNVRPPTTWTDYSGTITGSTDVFDANKFPNGTAYVKLYIIAGAKGSTGSTWWDNIKFEEIGANDALEKVTVLEKNNNIFRFNYKGKEEAILYNRTSPLTEQTITIGTKVIKNNAEMCVLRNDITKANAIGGTCSITNTVTIAPTLVANTTTPIRSTVAPTPVLNTSTPIPNYKDKGDLNNDNKVDILDLSILASKYGTTNTIADINGDGRVDILDLSILSVNWLKIF